MAVAHRPAAAGRAPASAPPAIARLALRTARVALYVTREDTNCWPGGQDSQGPWSDPSFFIHGEELVLPLRCRCTTGQIVHPP